MNGMQTSGMARKESFELDGDAVVETCVVGGFVPDVPKGVEVFRNIVTTEHDKCVL